MSDDDERGNGETGLSQQLGDADIAGSDDDGEGLRDDELLDYDEEPAHDAAKANVASAKKSAKKTEAKQVVKDEATGKMDTSNADTIPTQCIKNQLCCKKPQFASGKHLGFCLDANGKKLTGKEATVITDEPIPVVEGTRVVAGRGMRSGRGQKQVKAEPHAYEYKFGTDHAAASASAVKEADEKVRKAEEALLKAKKAKMEALAYEITVDERMIAERKAAECKK